MKRGAFVNLLIGLTIALLPLYLRVSVQDFQRTAKDNLLVGVFCLLGFLLEAPKRKASASFYIFLIYAAPSLVMNQWNVLSINVIIQFFYISSALFFFYSYYEKHDSDSVDYILNGMMAGALIQSTIAIPAYFGIELYPHLVSIFTDVGTVTSTGIGASNTVGSLGNNNLLSSYLAICSLSFFSLKKGKLLIIIPLIAIFLTGSLMGIVSVLAGICYFINLKLNFLGKCKIYLASIAAMIIYPFSGIGHDSGRIQVWRDCLSRVDLRHFLIGKGPGWFPDSKLMYNDSYMVQEHNSYLSAFNVFGIIGIILLLPVFIKFLKTKDSNHVFASVLFASFINSYAHFTSHQSTVVIVILVTASICIAEGNIQ